MLLSACGPTALQGPVTVDVAWRGTWSPADRALVEAFIADLAPSGYLNGLPVAFHLVDVAGDVHLELWAPALVMPVEYSSGHGSLWYPAWHDVQDGRPCVVVAPSRALEVLLLELAHELVEAAADPWLTEDALELADRCEHAGLVRFVVAGAERPLPRYWSGGACVPF